MTNYHIYSIYFFKAKDKCLQKKYEGSVTEKYLTKELFRYIISNIPS